MSFQESDFPGLIKIMATLNEQYQNPALSMKILEEVIKNYNMIPLYPGLVGDTVAKMIKNNYSNIKPGDWISFKINNEQYSGYVKEIKDNKIIFGKVFLVKEIKNFSINREEIKNVIKVNEEQLKEDWPMLIFDNEAGG